MKDGQADLMDALLEKEPADAQPAEASPSEPPVEEPQGQPRDEKGRFATKAEEPEKPTEQGVKPEAQPAPAAEPPAAETDEVRGLRAALKAEREKRQALEEQAKPKPAASAQPSPSSKSPEFNPPQVDFEQDPRAYLDAQVHSIRMGTSWDFAVMQSSEGEMTEAWNAFDEACKSDPQVNAWSFSPELRNHRHPMGEVLKWHRRQKQMAQIDEAGGLEAFIAAEIARRSSAQPAPAAQPAASAPAPVPATPVKPTPPPSLANGGNGSVDAPEMPTDDDDFKRLFGDTRKPRKR